MTEKLSLKQIRKFLDGLDNPEVSVEKRQRALTKLVAQLADRTTELIQSVHRIFAAEGTGLAPRFANLEAQIAEHAETMNDIAATVAGARGANGAAAAASTGDATDDEVSEDHVVATAMMGGGGGGGGGGDGQIGYTVRTQVVSGPSAPPEAPTAPAAPATAPAPADGASTPPPTTPSA